MAIVGLVPAAGYATRLQPLDGSKEVLPILGRPVIDHVLERMRRAECTRLRVITRAEKRDVIDHCAALGAEVVLAHPATTSESFAAGLEGLSATDIVLLGWPDTIWEPVDGYVPLVEAVRAGAEVALGLFRLPAEELVRSDVIRFDPDGAIAGIAIKPAEPPSSWIWGCAATRARALARLAESEWPGAHFDRLCREGTRLHAVRHSDAWLDIGTAAALARARRGDPFVTA